MVFAIILKLSPSPKPQLDQPAHGSRAANIHAFVRRFKPASIRRRITSDLVTPSPFAREADLAAFLKTSPTLAHNVARWQADDAKI